MKRTIITCDRCEGLIDQSKDQSKIYLGTSIAFTGQTWTDRIVDEADYCAQCFGELRKKIRDLAETRPRPEMLR
jgi:hypothetical protein